MTPAERPNNPVCLLAQARHEELREGFILSETRARLYELGYTAVTLERALNNLRSLQ